MRRRIALGMVALGTVVPIMGAQESWTPVVAKIRETYEVQDKNGRQISREVKEGNFYRNAEGSALYYWLTVDGDESRGGSGKLSDNRKPLEYLINTKTKVAILQPQVTGEQPLKPDFLVGARSSKLGQQSIEGIVCYLTKITLTTPDKQSKPIGTACQSPDYGLTLQFKTRVVSPDGSVHLTVRELYDIRLGSSPDPKLFQLTPGFQILKPQ